jgi:hypothetical protein
MSLDGSPSVPDIAPDLVTAARGSLFDAGFRPVPLVTGDKYPTEDDWRRLALLDQPPCTVGPARRTHMNTGILCDGLRAVDLDIEDETRCNQVEDAAIAIFGRPALVRYRDNSSRIAMVYRAASGEPGKRSIEGPILGHDANGKEIADKVEILGRGQQLHALGRHPSGADLKWGPAAPGQVKLSDLLTVSEDQVTAFLEAARQIIGAKPEKPLHERTDASDFMTRPSPCALPSDIAAALEVTPNDDVGWDT